MKRVIAKNSKKFKVANNNKKMLVMYNNAGGNKELTVNYLKSVVATTSVSNGNLLLTLPEMPTIIKDYFRSHLPTVRLAVAQGRKSKFNNLNKWINFKSVPKRLDPELWTYPVHQFSTLEGDASAKLYPSSDWICRKITLDELESGTITMKLLANHIQTMHGTKYGFHRSFLDHEQQEEYWEVKLVLMIHETDIYNAMDSSPIRIYFA